jgi:hypothetical protein
VAGRQADIGVAQGIGGLVEGDPVAVHLLGGEQQLEFTGEVAGKLDLLDPVDLTQRDLQYLGGNCQRGVAVVAGKIDADSGEPVVDIKEVEDRRFRQLRQFVEDGEHLEPHVVEPLAIVAVVGKLDNDIGAFAVGSGADKIKILDILQSLFDRVGDEGLDLLGRSARQEGVDVHLAELDVRVALDRHPQQHEGADHDQQHEGQVGHHLLPQGESDNAFQGC